MNKENIVGKKRVNVNVEEMENVIKQIYSNVEKNSGSSPEILLQNFCKSIDTLILENKTIIFKIARKYGYLIPLDRGQIMKFSWEDLFFNEVENLSCTLNTFSSISQYLNSNNLEDEKEIFNDLEYAIDSLNCAYEHFDAIKRKIKDLPLREDIE